MHTMIYIADSCENDKICVRNYLKNEIVKNHDIYQKVYGLLNYISIDNQRNQHKTGHYKLNYKKLFLCYLDDICAIKYEKIKSGEELAKEWAIQYENKELFKVMANDIIKSIQTKEETL